MKSFFYSFLFFFFISASAIFAQTEPPASLPVSSLAEYKAYALSQVRQAQISYNFRYGVESNYDGLFIQGDDVVDVMQKVNNYSFTFDTSRVDEERVTTYLWLMDSDGYTTFQGSSVDDVVQENGKAKFSPKIELRLESYVPLSIPGLDEIEIRVMTEWGYRETVYTGKAYNNRVWVPLKLIGSQYEFSIQMQDGNIYVYQNGKLTSTTEVIRTNANFTVNQFYEVKLGLDAAEFVLALDEDNKPTPPVFKLNTLASNALIQIDTYIKHKDGGFERPVRVRWFNTKSPSSVIVVPVGLDGKLRVTFPDVGTYYLSVEYSSLENAPYEPNPGNG